MDLSSGAAIAATLHALAADEARFLAALVAEAWPYYAPIKAFDLWNVVIAARKHNSVSVPTSILATSSSSPLFIYHHMIISISMIHAYGGI